MTISICRPIADWDLVGKTRFRTVVYINDGLAAMFTTVAAGPQDPRDKVIDVCIAAVPARNDILLSTPKLRNKALARPGICVENRTLPYKESVWSRAVMWLRNSLVM